MRRMWRRDPQLAMGVYIGLDLLLLAGLVAASHLESGNPSFSVNYGGLLLDLWLVWRVVRHRGRIAWSVLLAWNLLVAVLVAGMSVVISAGAVAVVVVSVAQVALLLSPGVRRHLNGAPTVKRTWRVRGRRRQPRYP
jgi:hypothetical protein